MYTNKTSFIQNRCLFIWISLQSYQVRVTNVIIVDEIVIQSKMCRRPSASWNDNFLLLNQLKKIREFDQKNMIRQSNVLIYLSVILLWNLNRKITGWKKGLAGMKKLSTTSLSVYNYVKSFFCEFIVLNKNLWESVSTSVEEHVES